ncbi:MAG: hypothetical protein ABI557_11875 [Aureliella sp.]
MRGSGNRVAASGQGAPHQRKIVTDPLEFGYNGLSTTRIVGGELMSKSIHGTVAGNLIRFEEPLGLPDGTGVKVVVRSIELSDQAKRLKLESLFGSCRNDAGSLDAFILENAAQRRLIRAESIE